MTETKRLKGVLTGSSRAAAASSTNLMSYCIIRNRKLNKAAKNHEKISNEKLNATNNNKTSLSNKFEQKFCSFNSKSRSKDVNKQRDQPSHSDQQCILESPMMMSAQWLSQSSAIDSLKQEDCFGIVNKNDVSASNQKDISLPSCSPSLKPSLHSSSTHFSPNETQLTLGRASKTTTTTCQLIDNQNPNDNPTPEKLIKITRSKERRDSSGFGLNKCFSLLLALIVLYMSITTQNNGNSRKSYNSLNEQQHMSNKINLKSATNYPIIEDLFHSITNLAQEFLIKQTPRIVLAEAQYKPEWPSKTLQQEIFLLNLEDGYFGCQVNESQDFLQLFELSRLCDGRTECYLGTDELATPLKCNNRERCGSYQNSRGQQENIQCVNGVCLDGLCYCNDGFGGKSCDVPDENECKFRPCDVFAHCTNTMGSYYCSCFPGKSLV